MGRMALRVNDLGHLVCPEAAQGLAAVHQLPTMWLSCNLIPDGQTHYPQRSEGQLQGTGQTLLGPSSPQAVAVTHGQDVEREQ